MRVSEDLQGAHGASDGRPADVRVVMPGDVEGTAQSAPSPARTADDVAVPKRKVIFLSTAQLATLNAACIPIREALGGVYLVGSATEKADYRDVDVRCIVEDDMFDAIFGGRMNFWGLFSWAVSEWLSKVTGLPVDFQAQRQTEANAKHDGQRHPLGMRSRLFAGGGDATNFYPERPPNSREDGQ